MYYNVREVFNLSNNISNNSTKEKIDEGRIILEDIKGWINNVDTKISIILAFMVVWLGYIAIDSNVELLNKINNVISVGLINITFIQFIKGLIISNLYITSVISIVLFLHALRANINFKNINSSLLTFNSNIFFGSISKLDYRAFKNNIYNQSDKHKVNDIYSQIYINSVICTKKFKLYNIGTYFAEVSILLFILCKILNVI